MQKLEIKDAFDLFMQGSNAFSIIEGNGIRIDTDYLDKTISESRSRIAVLEDELKNDDVYALWLKKYGTKFKLGSPAQLGKVLVSMGHKLSWTNKGEEWGQYKANEEALNEIDIPFVKKYLSWRHLSKATNTYLINIREETVDGYMHPSFNLHTVTTYRSSGSSPNFQNFPIRNPEIGKIIRSCIIARNDHQLVETDFGALEFRIAASWWDDPKMIAYATDKTKDIHRDKALACYKLPKDQWTKNTRYCAKNKFVFPKLYGSYYVKMARALWEAIDEMDLKTASGIPLKQHLADNGILSMGRCEAGAKYKPVKGTFEYHIKEQEEKWDVEFPIFAAKRDDWWKKYKETGEFQLMTGFTIKGKYSKNFLLNAPIQGPGFHCLLWSIIQLQKWLRKTKKRSVIVGQIHDSCNSDVHKDELQEYLNKIDHIIRVELPEAWKWIKVPLEVEQEVCPLGGNWFQKEAWVRGKDGVWGPVKKAA